MTPRGLASLFLAAGALLAAGTPLYVASAVPGLAGYLRHPAIVAGQLVPFVVCALIWLPRQAPWTMTAAVAVSAVLLGATAVVDGAILWAPASRGGDMIGLAFVAMSLSGTVLVLALSAIAGLIGVVRRRRGSRPRVS